jgi:hypothetical protein
VDTGITLELGIGGKSAGALVTSVDGGPATANFVSGLQVDGWRGLKWACATCISCVATGKVVVDSTYLT